jgi:hypothetical protein
VGRHPAVAVTWPWPSPGRGRHLAVAVTWPWPSPGRGRHLAVAVTWPWAFIWPWGFVWGGHLAVGCLWARLPVSASFAGGVSAVGLRLRGLLVGLLFWLGFMAAGGLGDASDGCGLAGGCHAWRARVGIWGACREDPGVKGVFKIIGGDWERSWNWGGGSTPVGRAGARGWLSAVPAGTTSLVRGAWSGRRVARRGFWGGSGVDLRARGGGRLMRYSCASGCGRVWLRSAIFKVSYPEERKTDALRAAIVRHFSL